MADHVEAIAALLPGAESYLTGSRAICPQLAEPATDWDYLVKVVSLKAAAKLLVAADFVVGKGSLEATIELEIKPHTKFVSMKRDGLNIIATHDKDFFTAFQLATRTATKLGLVHKQDRVLLFQAILYKSG